MPCPLPRWTKTGASVGCFPVPLGPSPSLRRVGVHHFTFEACSGFTHVTACRIARPPKAAFVTRLRPVRLPAEPLVSYQSLPTTPWVDPASTGEPRRWGALRNAGFCNGPPGVNPSLLSSVQIAGVLLLSAVGADGRCLIGSDEDWPANLGERSHLAGCSRICGLT